MSLSKLSIRAIVFAVCDVFLATVADAQYRAGIQDVVADAQGAVVEGATITLKAKETGISKTTTSDSNDVYVFSALAPGHYSVVAEKTGFKKEVLDDVVVVAEQTNAVNVQLQVGQVTEAVTVSAEVAPPIDTESGAVAGNITTSEIQALPFFGRDVFQLLQLAPGVFGDGSRNAGGDTQAQPGNQGPGGTGGSAGIFQTENRPQISANGGRQNANNVTLDGIGITSVSWGGAAIVTPNEDSVKEVKVVSNGYDAESGRFAGAQFK